MSRECNSDFADLKNFISNYSLNNLLSDNDFTVFIKIHHKKYFSYLTFIAEISNYVNKRKFINKYSKKQNSFIIESCSDIGMAYFSSFHGNYKAAKLLLRSSIETFLKGFCLSMIKDIDKEKRLFAFFRKIKALTYFKNPYEKGLLDEIHNQYKLLCKDVHTASIENMTNVTALNYFPKFEKEEAELLNKTMLVLIPNYLTLLCLRYNEQFHLFHYKNKKNIIESIAKKYRPKINNIE